MADLEGDDIWGAEGEGIDAEILAMGNEELRQRMRLLDNGELAARCLVFAEARLL
jgi:hypothetical protein